MVLTFWSIADDERARCAAMIERYRAARDRLPTPGDEVMITSNVRLPGATGLSVFLGYGRRVRRAHHTFVSYVEALSAKHHCADIDWLSFAER